MCSVIETLLITFVMFVYFKMFKKLNCMSSLTKVELKYS